MGNTCCQTRSEKISGKKERKTRNIIDSNESLMTEASQNSENEKHAMDQFISNNVKRDLVSQFF